MNIGSKNGAAALTVTTVVNGLNQSGVLNYAVAGASGSSAITIGAVTIGVGANSLSAYGSTSVAVTIDQGASAYLTPLQVSFSSSCANAGYSSITPAVLTVAGVATASYKDNGCAGPDVISISVNGLALSTTATINVDAPALGSIQFISASPTVIALAHTGGVGRSETSTVTFKVVDQQGNPIAAPVSFALNTGVGGVKLPVSSGNSDRTTGLVSTIVQSGTIATPVLVTASATVGSNSISTQSDNLSISTGIADQWHFTVTPAIHNFEGADQDNVTNTISILSADHFGNPVPDGTTVQAITQYGSVQPQCNTIAGKCQVTYTTQNPRPDFDYPNFINTTPAVHVNATAAFPYAIPFNVHHIVNRLSVLAYAVGEESFRDLAGNGYATGAEGTLDTQDASGNSTDIGEAFLDNAMNLTDAQNSGDGYEVAGAYDATVDSYIDFNGNGIRDGKDGQYEGILCLPSYTAPKGSVFPDYSSPCATTKSQSVNVFRNTHLVLSGSHALITIVSPGGANKAFSLGGCINGAAGINPVTVYVSDEYYNVMPAGTTITIAATDGTIVGGKTYTVGDSTAFYSSFNTEIDADGSWSGGAAGVGSCNDTTLTGAFTVTVTTPKNNTTVLSVDITN